MNRRNFIKQGTGGIPAIKGTVILIVIISLTFLLANQEKLADDSFVATAFPASEKETSPSSFILFLKLCGIVIGALLALTFLQLMLENISKKMASLIPSKIKHWYFLHKKKLYLFYYIALSSFLIYYCILKDQYLLLIFGVVWMMFSFLKNPTSRSY